MPLSVDNAIVRQRQPRSLLSNNGLFTAHAAIALYPHAVTVIIIQLNKRLNEKFVLITNLYL